MVREQLGARPAQALELYEFEACPFCRKVREALTELDLEVVVYPCPPGGTRYRPAAVERSGKKQFPFLVDPNTGVELLESDDITHYLFERYGSGEPGPMLAGPLATASAALSGVGSLGRGYKVRPSRPPEKQLELYSFEGSPYARLVRERLCEMELPYLLHNVGKARTLDYIPAELKHGRLEVQGESRKRFVARSGKMMVPYLVDPNSGWESFESLKILRYLEETYGA